MVRLVLADAQAIFIKDQAALGREGDVDFLPRAKPGVAWQQDFNIVVAVTLTEEIRIVPQPFDHFALKRQHRAAAGIG